MALLGSLVRVLGGLVSVVVLLSAIFLGWLTQTSLGPGEGVFFATLIPLLGRQLPPTLVGHGRMTGVQPVPDDLQAEPRPANELFLELPFKQKMPQNGLGMCCRPTGK
jgi:hypothetical protein